MKLKKADVLTSWRNIKYTIRTYTNYTDEEIFAMSSNEIASLMAHIGVMENRKMENLSVMISNNLGKLFQKMFKK